MIHTDLAPRPVSHPVLYSILIVPFGATGGLVGVALGFLATKSGLSVTQGASLIAVGMFPNVWKFFWAPIGDKTLTRRRWYLLSVVACALPFAAFIWALARIKPARDLTTNAA